MTAFVGFPQDEHSFSAAEVGWALAGLVMNDAGVPRVGMLSTAGVSAVAASWKVLVGKFVYVHQINGAVQFSGLSADEQVDIVPSGGIPVGQARIDVVCWDPVEAVLSVVAGTPAVSPVEPSAGVLAPVARVRVNAGDGMVVAAQVSPMFAVTGLVAAGSDTEWINAPGVTVVDGSPRAQYRLHGDMVEIVGRGRKSGGGYGMFTLPEAMRFPAGALRFPTEDGAEIEISSSGVVSSTNFLASNVTFNVRYRKA